MAGRAQSSPSLSGTPRTITCSVAPSLASNCTVRVMGDAGSALSTQDATGGGVVVPPPPPPPPLPLPRLLPVGKKSLQEPPPPQAAVSSTRAASRYLSDRLIGVVGRLRCLHHDVEAIVDLLHDPVEGWCEL